MPVQKPGNSKQNYRTPPAFLNAVRARLGIKNFTCDFAADRVNTVCPVYWSKQDDSLSKASWEWVDRINLGWGWLNPEYIHIAPWAERCADVGAWAYIALLVPAGVGSNWFRDYVDGQARVLLLNGRLDFIPGAPYPKDCILCLYGPDIEPGYDVWNWRADA